MSKRAVKSKAVPAKRVKKATTVNQRLKDSADEADFQLRRSNPLALGNAFHPAGTLAESTGRLVSNKGLVIRLLLDSFGIVNRDALFAAAKRFIQASKDKSVDAAFAALNDMARWVTWEGVSTLRFALGAPVPAEVTHAVLCAAAAALHTCVPTREAALELLRLNREETLEGACALLRAPPVLPFRIIDEATAKRRYHDPLPVPFHILEPGFGEYADVFAAMIEDGQPDAGFTFEDMSRRIAAMHDDVKVSFVVTNSSLQVLPDGARALRPGEALPDTVTTVVYLSAACETTLHATTSFTAPPGATQFVTPELPALAFAAAPGVLAADPGPDPDVTEPFNAGVLISGLQKAARRRNVSDAILCFDACFNVKRVRNMSGMARVIFRLPVIFVEDMLLCGNSTVMFFLSFAAYAGLLPGAEMMRFLRVHLAAAVDSPLLRNYCASRDEEGGVDLGLIQPDASVLAALCMARAAMPGMASDKTMLARHARYLAAHPEFVAPPQPAPRSFLPFVSGSPYAPGALAAMLRARPYPIDMHVYPGILGAIGASLSKATLAAVAKMSTATAGSLKATKQLKHEAAISQVVWEWVSAVSTREGARFVPREPDSPVIAEILAALRKEQDVYIDARAATAEGDGAGAAMDVVVRGVSDGVPVSPMNPLGVVLAEYVTSAPQTFTTNRRSFIAALLHRHFFVAVQPSAGTRRAGNPDTFRTATVFIPEDVMLAEFECDIAPFLPGSDADIPKREWLVTSAEAVMDSLARVADAAGMSTNLGGFVAHAWQQYVALSADFTVPFRPVDMQVPVKRTSALQMIKVTRGDTPQQVTVASAAFKSFGRGVKLGDYGEPFDLRLDAPFSAEGDVTLIFGEVVVPELLRFVQGLYLYGFTPSPLSYSKAILTAKRRVLATEAKVLPATLTDMQVTTLNRIGQPGAVRALAVLRRALFRGSARVSFPSPTRNLMFGSPDPRDPNDVQALHVMCVLLSSTTAAYFATPFDVELRPGVDYAALGYLCSLLEGYVYGGVPPVVPPMPAAELEAAVAKSAALVTAAGFRTLHDTQLATLRTAVAHLNSASCGYMVSNPCGSGKTLTVLLAMLALSRDAPQKILVLAPASALSSWQKEAASRTNFPRHPATDRPLFRVLILSDKASAGAVERALNRHTSRHVLVVAAYDHFRDRVRKDTPFLKSQVFDFLVLDESHYLRNNDTLRYAAVEQVLVPRNRVIAMTGTPQCRGPPDIVSQAALLHLPWFRSGVIEHASLPLWFTQLNRYLCRHASPFPEYRIAEFPTEVLELTADERAAYDSALRDAKDRRRLSASPFDVLTGLFAVTESCAARMQFLVDKTLAMVAPDISGITSPALLLFHQRRDAELREDWDLLSVSLDVLEPDPAEWNALQDSEALARTITDYAAAIDAKRDMSWRPIDPLVPRCDENVLVVTSNRRVAAAAVAALNAAFAGARVDAVAIELRSGADVARLEDATNSVRVGVTAFGFHTGFTVDSARTVIMLNGYNWNPQEDVQATHRIMRLSQAEPRVLIYRAVVNNTVEQHQQAVSRRRAELNSMTEGMIMRGSGLSVTEMMREMLNDVLDVEA